MSPSPATTRIAALAARQHGNVTLPQLRAAGLSRQEVRGRVEAGWLIERHHHVFAVGHRPRTQRSRWMAGVLTFGERAALSHLAAGALYEMVRGSVPTEVLVPSRSGRVRRDGILVHRAPFPDHHVTVHDGIPVTTLLRTHLDLATILGYWELRRAFEEAQVRHGFDPAPLTAEVLTRRGFRGSALLWGILDGAVDASRVRSILELRFLQLCADRGLPAPLVNERIGRWTVDFLWPAAELVVETDGERYHRTAAKRRRDAKKDEAMRALGLDVVRLTWRDVTRAPDATAARVAEALRGGLDVAQWLEGSH